MMMILSPSTSSWVDRASMPVSSLLFTRGTGESKSPSTRSRMRSAQAFIGTLMFPASQNATALETSTDTAILM